MNKREYDENRPRKVCPKCGQSYTVSNFERHFNACNGENKRRTTRIGLRCVYCGKLCKNSVSVAQHEIRCPKNPNRKDYNKLGLYSLANRKGKTKQSCEEISKAALKLKQGYENGSVNRYHFKQQINNVHSEHNNSEIAKWISFVKELKFNLPSYDTSYCTGYRIVKNLCKESKIFEKVFFEHELVLSAALNINNVCDYTIHHINKIRDDNTITNLMMFASTKEHLQFHRSEYAWLVYDDMNHLFHTEIRKI